MWGCVAPCALHVRHFCTGWMTFSDTKLGAVTRELLILPYFALPDPPAENPFFFLGLLCSLKIRLVTLFPKLGDPETLL
jgi:hypothetical protein